MKLIFILFFICSAALAQSLPERLRCPGDLFTLDLVLANRSPVTYQVRSAELGLDRISSIVRPERRADHFAWIFMIPREFIYEIRQMNSSGNYFVYIHGDGDYLACAIY